MNTWHFVPVLVTAVTLYAGEFRSEDITGLRLSLVDEVKVEHYSFEPYGVVLAEFGRKRGPVAGPTLFWMIHEGRLLIAENGRAIERFELVEQNGTTLKLRRSNGEVVSFETSRVVGNARPAGQGNRSEEELGAVRSALERAVGTDFKDTFAPEVREYLLKQLKLPFEIGWDGIMQSPNTGWCLEFRRGVVRAYGTAGASMGNDDYLVEVEVELWGKDLKPQTVSVIFRRSQGGIKSDRPIFLSP